MRREGLFDANRNGSGEADDPGGEEVKLVSTPPKFVEWTISLAPACL